MHKVFPLFLAIIFGLMSGATGQTPVVWEPDVSLSGNIAGSWSWSSKLVTRVSLGQLGDNTGSQSGKLILGEAQAYLNRRLVGGRRLTFGLLYGIENPLENERSTELRFIWQFSKRHAVDLYGFSHRFRLEQRVYEDRFQHRARYRIVAERPLSGDRIDPREWYLIAGTEVLLSADEELKNFRLDNRTGIGVGWLFANEHRLQFELQHRAQRMFDARYQSGLWLLTSWVVPL
ncbi:MAG: DUF2490 domain-containing protein [Bacteroidetes bacterium]|nr:DUF2490 domain-containing protein [Bacteroidota bacterium]